MTIPKFTVPYIFWRPSKVYGMHKMCITGGSFISGEYLKGNRPPNFPVPAIPMRVTFHRTGPVSIVSQRKRHWYNLLNYPL